MSKIYVSLAVAVVLSALTFSDIVAQESNSPAGEPLTEEITTERTTASDLEAEHAELRQLRETLVEAVIANDIATQIKFVHDDVVTTWQNNAVARGQDGLKAFMDEMNQGEVRVFQGYRERPVADDLAIFHNGNTAIAFGSSVPQYKYMGKEFELENRWTATLVKSDGQWKIAAYHVSANVMDNPILDAALQSVMFAAVIALAVGLLIGVIGTRLVMKKRQPAA